MNRQEVLDFCKNNNVCHLATVEEGAPRVRALRVFKIDDDGIVLQVWKSKDVGKQLARNPEVELCFNNYGEGIQLRVRGRVELVEDAAENKQVMIDHPNLQKFVDQGHEIVLYRLKKGLAHIWTMKQNFAPKAFIEL
ncbi:pyridoxamine 5'-phosphate oxidase family protein [Chloroflexota bacterium]